MDSKLFAGALERNAGRVSKRLAAYLRDPEDGESVHDVRTSLRRLEAAFSLLPKKARMKNRAQIKAYKEFFRANSHVRDYDIIREKLAGANDAILAGIDRKRKAELGRALALARAVHALPALDTKINGKKLGARADKVAGKLLGSIEERLPAALADSDEKEELHELRKDLKKLRYVLEILPAGSRKGHEKKLVGLIKARGAVAEKLKELQDLTGSIHDCDIAIDYLKSARKVGSILQEQMTERDELFNKFVKTFS